MNMLIIDVDQLAVIRKKTHSLTFSCTRVILFVLFYPPKNPKGM